MAFHPRQSWYDLLNEFIHRCGMNDETATDFPTRAQNFLTAGYYDVCLLFHHYELDTIDDSRDFAVGDLGMILPSNLYILMAVDLFTPSAGSRCFIKTLEFQESRLLITGKHSKEGEPSKYTRFGHKIIVDKAPDILYGTEIYYYRTPSPPEFEPSVYPETSRLWDQHILEAALAISNGAVWRPDLGDINRQAFSGFGTSSVQPPLRSERLHPRDQDETRTFPHGGAQG